VSASRVEFRRFHHVTLAVADLSSAVADWTERLGWEPAVVTSERATFALDDGFIDLVPTREPDAGSGVVAVSVVVDDVHAVAERIEAAGTTVTHHPDGRVTMDPSALTGVPLELHADEPVPDAPSPSPFRRINHVVVAVHDDADALARWAGMFGAWPTEVQQGEEVAHHLPVGIAWFGLTSAGTDSTALGRFLERRGEGVYALALVVDDHADTVTELASRGARMIGDATSPQVFVHPSTTHGILIDVVPERHPSRIAASG
jgi:methylmalonyl-CoA/ethylmalonyl-CoA epimerase